MRKSILTSMSAVEKKFIRKFVDGCLKKEGIARKKWPELKREALDRFRRVQDMRCASMADEAIEQYVESACPLFAAKVEKLAKEQAARQGKG